MNIESCVRGPDGEIASEGTFCPECSASQVCSEVIRVYPYVHRVLRRALRQQSSTSLRVLFPMGTRTICRGAYAGLALRISHALVRHGMWCGPTKGTGTARETRIARDTLSLAFLGSSLHR